MSTKDSIIQITNKDDSYVIDWGAADTQLSSTTMSTVEYDYITSSSSISISDWTFDNFSNANRTLHVEGDANFNGDIKIKGKSLTESLEKIEEKLAILHPNEELESRWEELRNLRNQYNELEKQLLEKEKVWNILKK